MKQTQGQKILQAKDLTNQVIGYLTVLYISKRENSRIYWLCRCVCGTTKEVASGHLHSKMTKSCGRCLKKEKATKHGMSGTRFYNIFMGILQRTTNPNSRAYINYGGRGISNNWATFADFKRDMYSSYNEHIEKYGETNTTIERVDNNGYYGKENCIWATRQEQRANQRKKTPTFGRKYLPATIKKMSLARKAWWNAKNKQTQ